jgi:nitrite reductase/ring-hydroxylating ferredoxin subunit
VTPGAATAAAPAGSRFVKVLREEDLPKGERREVEVAGKPVMLFWYRGEIKAIEARSPAEGFYSEGFLDAMFTQDGCIECPGTKSLFDIETGAIREWYPDNPVLRKLTPESTCRPMEVYEVEVDGASISLDPSGSLADFKPEEGALRSEFTMPGTGPASQGGVKTSVDRNNVFAVEPRSYLQGEDPNNPGQPADANAMENVSPTAIIVGTAAVALLGVGGTAYTVVNENWLGLAAFWAAGFGVVALFIVKSGYLEKDN